MKQLSFQASPVSIRADTVELSACQKYRQTDGQTDGQIAFQLYIVEDIHHQVC